MGAHGQGLAADRLAIDPDRAALTHLGKIIDKSIARGFLNSCRERYMTKITYEIVKHDGGWAYRVEGVFSEPFPTHDLARKAAEHAAREQVVAGNETGISYEDKDGHWHDELSRGDDRPQTDVKG
jgi:hypothetical protein